MSNAPQKQPTLSPEDMEKIRAASRELMMKAAEILGKNPAYVLGTFSLATAQMAVLCKTSYEQLIGLVAAHYESVLLAEVADELHEAGDPAVMIPKPEGPH